MLKLHQLKYFVMTVEKGSLNKAAKALYISQPALTKQLTSLESDLDCRLFNRGKAGIEVTEAGRYLYEKACGILEQVKKTIDGVKHYSESQPMRIGALPSLASYYLPMWLGTLQKNDEPRVQITIRDTSKELIDLVEKGLLDLAFLQDFTGHKQLKALHLLDEPYVAIVPQSHPLATESELTFQSLLNEKMVIHQDPCDIRGAFRRYCNQWGLESHHVLELGFNDSILAFVSQGYGISFVPKMVADHITDPGIVVKKLLEHTFNRKIDVVFESDKEELVRPLIDVHMKISAKQSRKE
jgi:DNA-binding transcriptional LysR family regulator